jgi:hypothetical protein
MGSFVIGGHLSFSKEQFNFQKWSSMAGFWGVLLLLSAQEAAASRRMDAEQPSQFRLGFALRLRHLYNGGLLVWP